MTKTPMDIEAFRLARAKAMRPVMKKNAACISAPCLYGDCLCADELARAIEAADAALGVVSVPREITDDMNAAYVDAYANSAQPTSWEARKEAYRAMLAASPLREKSDEQ